MANNCLIGKIWTLSSYLDDQVTEKIKEVSLPVLRRHMPLFYILPESGQTMKFNELASTWSISKSSLSDIVSKYQTLGFVEKCDCIEDKRNIYIHLTAEGLKLRQRLRVLEEEILDDCFGDFSDDEKRILNKMIDRALSCKVES